MASAYIHLIAVILFTFTKGVLGADNNYNIGPLVAAACVAFAFLVVIFAMIVVGAIWKEWFPAFQKQRGKVKRPRMVKKKEDIKTHLINGSRPASLGVPSEVLIPVGVNRARDTDEESELGNASWVNGWNNANPPPEKLYEELAKSMSLDDEKDDADYIIETTVVDNEVLDLGPFHDSSQPAYGESGLAPMHAEYGYLENGSVHSMVKKSRPVSSTGGSIHPLATSEAITKL